MNRLGQSIPPVAASRLVHERIPPIRRRDHGFLDRPGAHPAEQVHRAARLVVRPRRPGATEGLLTHDGPGGLVVDVEIAGRVSQRVRYAHDRLAVPREDRPGQGVGRRGVAEREGLFQAVILVYVYRQYGTEDLFLHGPEPRIRRDDGRRLDEPAPLAVAAAAGDDLGVVRRPGVFDVTDDVVEGRLVDHGRHEV